MCSELNPTDKTFRYGIGCFEANAPEIPHGFEKWNIPAHTWAVFKFTGDLPKSIQETWQRIYSEWLPQANYEKINSFDFEYYPHGDLSSPDYTGEIWVPVKEK
jgi:AraC family transcriptional regulator